MVDIWCIEETRLCSAQNMDVFKSREQLCLIDSVLRNGDANWGSIVQSLTPLFGPERQANYYTEEKCASQYQRLQRQAMVSETKIDRNVPIVGEPNKKNWKDTCHSKLVQDRIKELKAAVDEAKKDYYFYKQQMNSLKSGLLDNTLDTFLRPDTTEKEPLVRKAEPENVSPDESQESLPASKAPEIATLVTEVLVESEVTLTEDTQEDQGSQIKEITLQETETIIEKETPGTNAVPASIVVDDESKAGSALSEETIAEVGEEVLVEEIAEELLSDAQPVTTTHDLETVEETVMSIVDTPTPEEHVKEAEKPQETEEAIKLSEVTIKEELLIPLPEPSTGSGSKPEDVRPDEKDLPAAEKPAPSPIPQEIPAPIEEQVVIKEEVVEPATVEQPVMEAVDTSLLIEEEQSKKVDVAESDDEDIPLTVLRSKLQSKVEPPTPASDTVSRESVQEPAEVPVVDSVVVPPPIETEESKDVHSTLLRTDSTSTESNVEILNFNKSTTAFFKALSAFDNASLLSKPLPTELSAGILRPMDLGEIRKNVESQAVQTQKVLIRDVLLMFSNIFLAYESQSQVYQDVQTLHKQTLELIKETFPNVIPNANEKVQDVEPSLQETAVKEAPQLGKSRKGGKRQNSPMNDDSMGKRKKVAAE